MVSTEAMLIVSIDATLMASPISYLLLDIA